MMPLIYEGMVAVSNSLAASIVFKVTVTTTLALVSTRFVRRSRAAVRHVLLVATFAVLLVLPVTSTVVPSVRVAVSVAPRGEAVLRAFEAITVPISAAAITHAIGRTTLAVPQLSKVSISAFLLSAWVVGAVLFLLPVVGGLWQVRSLRRSGLPWRQGRSIAESLARENDTHRRVDVLLHESIAGPMTCGVVHPIVVLPVDAETWTTQDLHRALVHELEHVRRSDWISQCLARALCVCYWFHPLVWVAWRKLVLEAERACDDAVLRRAEATAYADQLVGLARRLSSSRKLPLLAMANRHDLATRVVAVLDSRQPRGRAGALAVVFIGTASALLVTTMSLRIVAGAQSVQATATRSPTTLAQSADEAMPKTDSAADAHEQSIPPGDATTENGDRGFMATLASSRAYIQSVSAEVAASLVGRRLVTIQLWGVSQARYQDLHLPIEIGTILTVDTEAEVAGTVRAMDPELTVRIAPLPEDDAALLVSLSR